MKFCGRYEISNEWSKIENNNRHHEPQKEIFSHFIPKFLLIKNIAVNDINKNK